MPIYEYICADCKKRFEALVMGSAKPECPQCHSRKLEQQLSVFAVSVGATPAGSPCSEGGCGMNLGGRCGSGACDLDS